MSALADLLTLGRVFASLVVVLAVAALAARAARRATQRGPGVGLHVVDRVGLSREASLAVVSVGGRALVVGVTSQGVRLLTELDAADLERRAEQELADRGADDDADLHEHAYEPPALRSTLRRRRTDRAPLTPLRGNGSVLDPRTWRQAIDGLRDLTTRR